MNTRILIIYTGGTIGMVQDVRTGALIPFDFNHLYQQVPELEKFDLQLQVHSLDKPIDSSDISLDTWILLTQIIQDNYHQFDGFVILHGSDTMAFTASALSFTLENLQKPVILTGSQLPIGVIRTDGKENLITAIEIAAARLNNTPIVPEVAIYFEYKLYRGNRTHKYNAEHFDAFESPNYPVLAEAGIRIKYHHNYILPVKPGDLIARTSLDSRIGVLKLYPGLNREYAESILKHNGFRAVVMETFGSGNGPTARWFMDDVYRAVNEGMILVNITQCNQGSVIQGRYQTSEGFLKSGVISGNDMTFEAAITKLMYLLGNFNDVEQIKYFMGLSLRGEVTIPV